LSKRIVVAIAVAIAFPVAGAQAQENIQPDQWKAMPPGGCPANGFAKPVFGAFGPNGDAQMGYELASPCNGLEVRAAAIKVGLGRYVPLGLKNVSSMRYIGEGSYGSISDAKITAHISFVVPGIRMAVEGGAAKEIRVFADGRAWNENAPGLGESAVPTAAGSERQALIKLTPQGALWSIIEAEGTAKVSKAGGKTVLTGTSPYDGIPVTVTLAADNMIEQVSVRHGGHTYGAKFYDYKDHWDTGLSPNYLNFFPSRMVWTLDGKPLADLKTTDFKSNAYVVFPRTSSVAENPSATVASR